MSESDACPDGFRRVVIRRGAAAQGRTVTPHAAPLGFPGTAFPLTDATLIGRGEAVDVRLADDFASERHARVSRTASGFVLEDLGSTNGTFLGERRINETVPLADGDEFTVGGTTLRYEVVT